MIKGMCIAAFVVAVFLIGCAVVATFRKLGGGKFEFGYKDFKLSGPVVVAFLVGGIYLLTQSVAWAQKDADQNKARVVETAAAAQRALEQAETLGATDYAPGSIQTAKVAEAALKAEVEAQSGKFAFFRSYGRADELAVNLTTVAAKAKNDTENGREQARVVAVQNVAEVSSAMQEAKSTLLSVPGGHGTHDQLAAFRTQLAGADSILAQAQKLIDEGKFREAKELADRARQSTASVQHSLLQAAGTQFIHP